MYQTERDPLENQKKEKKKWKEVKEKEKRLQSFHIAYCLNSRDAKEERSRRNGVQ